MKTIAIALISFISFVFTAHGQPLREKAAMDPIDCALYLNSKRELDLYDTSLVTSLSRLGRYDDILASTSKDLNFKELAHLGLDRLRAGDKVSADKFASAAKHSYERDAYGWTSSDLAQYIELLVGLGKADEAFGIAEKQETLDDHFVLLLQIAEGSIRSTQLDLAKSAIRKIPPNFFFSDARDLIRQSDVFAALGDRSEQVRLLSRIGRVLNSDQPNSLRDYLRLELARRYLSIGDETAARSLWESVSAQASPSDKLVYINALLKYGRVSQAEKMLDSIDPKNFGSYSNGTEVVRIFLSQNHPDKALEYATAISDGDDNFEQQSAFMALADYHISHKEFKGAEKILEIANSKASHIVYRHYAEDSIGASPGSRKAIYIDAIAKRYAALEKFDLAFSATEALDVDDPSAQRTFASAIARLARDNAKHLGLIRVKSLTEKAKMIAVKQDDDCVALEVSIDEADALAQLGQRGGATEIIAALLERSCGQYEESEALVRSGEIFEKYRLTANDHLRRVLSSIIADHGN